MKAILLAVFLTTSPWVYADSQNMTCEFLGSPSGNKFSPSSTPMTLSLEKGLLKDKMIWNSKEMDDAKFDKKSDTWFASSQNKSVNILFSNQNKILAIKNNVTDVRFTFACK